MSCANSISYYFAVPTTKVQKRPTPKAHAVAWATSIYTAVKFPKQVDTIIGKIASNPVMLSFWARAATRDDKYPIAFTAA